MVKFEPCGFAENTDALSWRGSLASPAPGHQPLRTACPPALRILEPGLLTTVQDLGRVGYQHLGVPTSGALDPVSLQAANLLVGNKPIEGALEIAYVGPTIVVEADSVNLACAGANVRIEILPDEAAATGVQYSSMQSFRVQHGQVVRIRFDVEIVGRLFGGRRRVRYRTSALAAFRRICAAVSEAGKAVRLSRAMPCRCGAAAAAKRDEFRLEGLDLARPSRFRVVLGPQHACISEQSIKAFLEGQDHDRSGDRSDGNAPRRPEARTH